MKLIADSGSTTTEWRIIDSSIKHSFKTIGMSPFFITKEDFVSELKTNLPTEINPKDIYEIHFFGTGCGSQENKNIIHGFLADFFQNSKITVETDLTGAAISMFGNGEGIAAILGTGMNLGHWKNDRFIYTINSLGYILGDEGSGAHLGKTFIKMLLENELPKEIIEEFYSSTKLDATNIIRKIYKEPFPNKFLASVTHFMYKHKSNEVISKIIQDCFESFIDKHVLKISKNTDIYRLSITGSISYFFKNEIIAACLRKNIKIDSITQSPINSLSNFHLSNE